jgi:(p)ppGpp synthase/HD superfamily hydrolase
VSGPPIISPKSLLYLNNSERQKPGPHSGPHFLRRCQSTGAELWQRLSAAIAYALSIHATQRRKGSTVPYIGHLLGVTSLVLEAGGDEEQAMAGVLHDAIEDVGAEQEAEIATRFGPRVARIVRACTDADALPKPPWRARKDAYLKHLTTAPEEVLLVSCADKLHNARAIVTDLLTHGPAMFARFNAGREETLWYYAALAVVFEQRLPSPLSRDLALAVREMTNLSKA